MEKLPARLRRARQQPGKPAGFLQQLIDLPGFSAVLRRARAGAAGTIRPGGDAAGEAAKPLIDENDPADDGLAERAGQRTPHAELIDGPDQPPGEGGEGVGRSGWGTGHGDMLEKMTISGNENNTSRRTGRQGRGAAPNPAKGRRPLEPGRGGKEKHAPMS